MVVALSGHLNMFVIVRAFLKQTLRPFIAMLLWGRRVTARARESYALEHYLLYCSHRSSSVLFCFMHAALLRQKYRLPARTSKAFLPSYGRPHRLQSGRSHAAQYSDASFAKPLPWVSRISLAHRGFLHALHALPQYLLSIIYTPTQATNICSLEA